VNPGHMLLYPLQNLETRFAWYSVCAQGVTVGRSLLAASFRFFRKQQNVHQQI